MRIQLKGEIHKELQSLGYKAGDIIERATVTNQPNKVAYFEDCSSAVSQHCSVWPENYDIV